MTGNISTASALKLGDMFPLFQHGYYGDSSELRDQIAQNAREHLHSLYSTALEIIIVGDTPHDIQCAKVIGAKSVAVSTGIFKSHELTSADVVLSNLEEAFRLNWFH